MPRMATKRQIQANRRNRRLWKGHSPEGLEKLRQAALLNQPWLKSTGPRTERGKARSSMNALRHGCRSVQAIANRKTLNAALRTVRELIWLATETVEF